ncbi:MAG: hypothetical protein WC095_01070 [Candidatus Paceibacterota bacterium]
MEKINWIAPEYIHSEKNSDWYWIVGIITVSIALVAIILNNIIFAILIIVSMSILTLYASRRPENIEIKINEKGINMGQTYYPYSDLESFWVETKDKFPRIIILPKKTVSSYIIILIKDVEPEDVKDLLSNYLEEVTHTESFLTKFLIYFGF